MVCNHSDLDMSHATRVDYTYDELTTQTITRLTLINDSYLWLVTRRNAENAKKRIDMFKQFCCK